MASSSSRRKHSSPTLSAIRYEGGVLKVLDQRLIPHDIVYKKIDRIEHACDAIRSMMGRGTSAIVIAAALSLAVDVSKFRSYRSTSHDPADYIECILNSLFASKPKTVIIPEIITKIKQITSNAVACDKSPRAVFQLYKEAAEAMLIEDVGIREDIATFGSALLCLQQPTGRISILTQPNTGSLATSEYGTVYGIIPVLNKIGLLERAYYTETHHIRQESKLEAFKLVQENLPATLIADSSVGDLIKSSFSCQKKRCVDAVVVAVDHMAANGDSVNRSGTFQLALCAAQHHIPFYVASPIASVDFSCSTGHDFYVKEYGRQTDPILSPAFDIIPADFIANIISEKGIIYKEHNNTFDIKGFIESRR